jgi:hypothetical protein
MFADLWNWITSFWWTVIITGSLSFGTVSYIFNKIIEGEMDRGGEEYGERATTRIQKWSIAILIISIGLTVGVIAFKVLEVLGIINIGK